MLSRNSQRFAQLRHRVLSKHVPTRGLFSNYIATRSDVSRFLSTTTSNDSTKTPDVSSSVPAETKERSPAEAAAIAAIAAASFPSFVSKQATSAAKQAAASTSSDSSSSPRVFGSPDSLSSPSSHFSLSDVDIKDVSGANISTSSPVQGPPAPVATKIVEGDNGLGRFAPMSPPRDPMSPPLPDPTSPHYEEQLRINKAYHSEKLREMLKQLGLVVGAVGFIQIGLYIMAKNQGTFESSLKDQEGNVVYRFSGKAPDAQSANTTQAKVAKSATPAAPSTAIASEVTVKTSSPSSPSTSAATASPASAPSAAASTPKLEIPSYAVKKVSFGLLDAPNPKSVASSPAVTSKSSTATSTQPPR